METLESVVKNISHADEPDGLRIRLLLTGTREYLQDICKHCVHFSTVIDLEPQYQASSLADLPQQKDIQAYISQELGKIPLFRGTLSKEHQDLKNEILEKLPKAALGDYNDLNRRLTEIKNSEEAQQIKELVSRVDQDSKKYITDQIDSLNGKQSGPRIRQIDDILIWVSAVKGLCNVKLLQSMIDMTSEGRGLINIADTIRRDCKKLLKVDADDDVSFQADAAEELQRAEPKRATVHESEINMIQAMLQTSFERTFGNQNIYQKFEFPRFFDEKRNMQVDLVHLPPPNDVSSRVLDICLRAICDIQESEKTRALRSYASANFDEHFIETDLINADSDFKAQIGPRLFRLLHEEAVINTWIDNDRSMAFWNMREWFDDGNEFFNRLIAFFNDRDVVKSIQAVSTETDWLYKEDYAKVPKPRILQHVARHALQHWYKGEFEDPEDALRWMRMYLQQVAEDVNARKGSWWDAFSAQDFDRWEKWASETFGPVLKKAEWQLRMAEASNAMADRSYNAVTHQKALRKKACDRCMRALELEPAKWEAQVLHGTILHTNKEYQASITQLEKLRKSSDSQIDNGYEKAYWERVVPTLADCQFSLGNFDAAIHWYREALDHEIAEGMKIEKVDFYACEIIKAFRRQGDSEAAVAYLQTLNQRNAEGKIWLQAMLENPWSDVHDHIVVLTAEMESFEVMNGYYTAAISDSGEDVKISGAWAFMRLLQWRLHWYCGTSTSRETVIANWMTIFDDAKDGNKDYSMSIRFRLVQELAHALSHLAKQSHLQSSEAQVYIARLEGIGKSIEDLTGYSLTRDANLVLARLSHLSGDDERAHNILRTSVHQAIDMIRDADSDPRRGYERLAIILPVLDDDENALAAWSLLDPDRVDDEGTRIASSDENVAAKIPDASVVLNGVVRKETAGADIAYSDGSNASDPLSGKADARAQPTTPLNSQQHQVTTVSDDTTVSESTESNDGLSGMLSFYCDGDCGKDWSYSDNMYVCKDCLCVQLDPTCYQKLQEGKLDIGICDKSHEHLHVPPFDIKTWRALDPTMVKLGGDVIKKDEWLQRLEVKWKLHDWYQARSGIHQLKLRWLARRMRRATEAQKAEDDPMMKPLEGAEKEVEVEAKNGTVVHENAVRLDLVAVAS